MQDDALGDPTRNHYQVHTQANASNSAFQSAAVGGYRNEPFFNDNEPHTVVIEYLPGVRSSSLAAPTPAFVFPSLRRP
jgi:hypothetical protein